MSINSPFPGMDPFMERRAIWRGVHAQLIVVMHNILNDIVPDNFDVNIEGDLKIVEYDADNDDHVMFTPDMYVVKRTPVRGTQADPVAIAEPIAIAPITTTIEERWLEIVDRDNQQLVTTIELLSPHNKTGDGFDKFAKKREMVRKAGRNWVEIDLLRGGKRPNYTIDLPEYYAMMMRGNDKRHKWYVWPMMLQERLPTIGIPLTDGYDDLPLDLQRAIDMVYKQAKFWRKLRYSERVPAPRLSAENQAYVAQKLTEWQNAHPE